MYQEFNEYNWYLNKLKSFGDTSGMYEIERMYGVVGLLMTNHVPTLIYTFGKYNVTLQNLHDTKGAIDFNAIKEVFDYFIRDNMYEPIRRFYRSLAATHRLKEFLQLMELPSVVDIDPFATRRIFYANQSNPIELSILRDVIHHIVMDDEIGYEYLHQKFFTTEERKFDIMLMVLDGIKDVVDHGLKASPYIVSVLSPIFNIIVKMRYSEWTDKNSIMEPDYIDFKDRIEALAYEPQHVNEMEIIKSNISRDILPIGMSNLVNIFKSYIESPATWEPAFVIFQQMLIGMYEAIEECVNANSLAADQIRWMMTNYKNLPAIEKVATCVLVDRTTIIDGVVNMLISDNIPMVEMMYSDMKYIYSKFRKKGEGGLIDEFDEL